VLTPVIPLQGGPQRPPLYSLLFKWFINFAGPLALISVFWTLALMGMPSRRFRQENAPPCVQFSQTGPDGAGPRPRSLTEFVTGNGVKVIVQGDVQSVEEGPVATGSSRRLIVGTLNISEVIKGPGSISLLSASAFNFGGNFSMQPHQRYILFLNDETAAGLRMVSERAGVPRMRIGAAFCIDSRNVVHSSTKGICGVASAALDPILGPLDGLSLESALSEIRKALSAAN